MNILSFILTIIGTALSALGIVLTIRGNKMAKNSKTIDWTQLQTAAKFLAKRLKRDSFVPDIIISPGQKGGIIAQLLVDYLDIEIPIYTGFLIPHDKKIGKEFCEDYLVIETTKWRVFLPKSLEITSNCSVLIVDDFVMSGDFLSKLRTELIHLKYFTSSIKSCSVAVTNVAIQTNKAPDYYWKKIDSEDSYFPWGKAR